MTNLRSFGLELECFNPRVGIQTSGQNIVTALRDMGIRARTNSHFGTDYSVWQIKPDSSLSPAGYALEVVSPTLPGTEASIEQVAKVAAWLGSNGYDVNRTCGYHIHIDASDITAYEASVISWRYSAHIASFNAILPQSRHTSQWGSALHGPALAKVENVVRNKNTRESWGTHERYAAVNLQHIAKGRGERRLEFRQHSGTLNPAKILGWYRLLCDFVAETLRILRTYEAGSLAAPRPTAPRTVRNRPGAMTTSRVVATAAPRVPYIEPGSDYDKFLNALARNGVVTQEDARSFGWPDTRLRVTAHWLRRQGADLITTERGGELAYVGANGATTRQGIFTRPAQIRQRVMIGSPTEATSGWAATNPAPAARDVSSLFSALRTAGILEGASPETVTWYRGRVEDFQTN